MHTFHNDKQIAQSSWIWVFGSNVTGIHAVGDAKIAKNNFGAVYGVSEGRIRECYAIPVKDKALGLLPIEDVHSNIERFFEHAKANPKERFFVTRIGCGPGGYKDERIAPMFLNAPSNCNFSVDWECYFDESAVGAAA